jgi:hypothetical protein
MSRGIHYFWLGASADADPALVASDQAASRLAPAGFDPLRVPLGLYRLYWASGGSSLASVYMDESGQRWIAPTNWVRPAPLSTTGWAAVEYPELLACK